MSARSEAQAREDLAALYYSAIKARSNLVEVFGGEYDDKLNPVPPGELEMRMLTDLHPWLFDPDKNIVPRLEAYTNPNQPVTPLEYYNWMLLCFMFAPVVIVGAGLFGHGKVPLAIEDVQLYVTWPDEEN